jgi:hypothetical protein
MNNLQLKMSNLKHLMIAVMVTFLAACSKDNVFDSELLILASQTGASQTRVTINNIWSDGEQVQVSINDAGAVTFTADWSGTLTPVNPIYWYSATQTISARAWYPASWVFPADQSSGLQAADFIFAPTIPGITFRNVTGTPLTFYHRTAKVTVNLTAGTDINSVMGATIAFYGYTSGTPDTSDAGNGTITGSGDGWVTPQNTEGDTYAALLIPRDMTDIRFVRITLDGFDYFYTPAADDANLQQGNSYTYNITVHKTRLEVTVVDDGVTWNAGDEHTVEGEII